MTRRYWFMVACGVIIVMIGGGLRQSFGVFLRPVSFDLEIGRQLRAVVGASGRFLSDAGGAPRRVEVRIDDGAVVALLPDDGIADQTPETYRLELAELTPGLHRVAVRVV